MHELATKPRGPRVAARFAQPVRMVARPSDPKVWELDPRFRGLADEWLKLTGHRIDNAYRSPAKQAQLYRRWLMGDPAIFRAARPGFSMHEYRLAFDIVGRPSARAVALARRLGMRWGGPGDPVHFDFAPVISLVRARREAGLA